MKAEFRQPYSKNRKPLQDLLPLDTPLTMYIDPTNICNFACKFCFNGDENSLKKMNKTMMGMDLFEKIVSDLKEFPSKVKMIHLHGFGEPLLNKNLAKMIELLKQEDVVERISITTNGTAFTYENMQAIIAAGLDQIHISIYGLSQEQYVNFTDTKANFCKLLENIKQLYAIKQNCHIHIKIVGDYFSKEEQEVFLDTFGNYCDTIFIDNAANIWPDLDISDTVNETAGLKHQYSEEIVANKICPQLFYQMLIHSDGGISPCCADFAQEVTIGNVNYRSLKDIWNSVNLNKMRIDHLNGNTKNYKACINCQYPSVGSSTNINPYQKELLNIFQLKQLTFNN